MKKGEVLKFKIEDYAFEGKGIAKVELEEGKKFVVFVHGAYPGDEVEARIVKKKKSFAEAKTVNILTASEKRTEPKCKHFGVCGGCKQQDLKYEWQLKFKEQQVKDAFERIAGIKEFESFPILPTEKIYRYRNKMEFSFADKRWLTKEELENSEEIKDRNFALGLHIPRIFDKVIDIEECYLQPETNDEILNFTREFFKSRNTTIYSTKTHSGYLRNLVIRNSVHTKDLMVNIVTSSEEENLINEYAGKLAEEIPEITTIVNNINTKKAQVAIGDYENVLYGRGVIYDFIGKNKYRISANSFFQTNTLQAEKLYQTGLDFAELNGNEIIYDLYSGAGTITLYFADFAKELFGFESVQPAVEDARENAKLNLKTNVNFFTADLNKSFMPIVKENSLPLPDVVVADPPRSGMNPKTVRDILKLSPEKIVYISCNPATQARDVQMLKENGDYELVKIRSVDMFPHTFHIENVVLLVRKSTAVIN
jgi:23S rRNA (uracil1939-C5)-methyltransferase